MVGIYLPMIPEVGGGDAGLRPHRRRPQRRLRRLLGRVGAGADGVLRGQGAGHRRRRPPQGQDGADQARGRRADGRAGDAEDDRRRPPHRHRVPDAARAATSSTTRSLAAADPECPAEPMEAEHPLYILYTSGSTAKPKGILHTTGGYMTGVTATHRYVFDLKPESDVYWCAADVGWVTGHSYIVYGPLANGATSVMWEGAPDYPGKGIWWELIERYKATILYAAPTAIRTFIKWGADIPERSDLSSLRLLGSVGEPINPKAWLWYHKVIGGERCPIVDTWWQTETGAIMITPLPGITATKPGSATTPFPGVEAQVVDESEGEAGRRRPGPAGPGAPLALDAARPLQGGRSLRRDLLLALRQGALPGRRRRPPRRRRLLLGDRPHRRRRQRLRPPALDGRGRVGDRRPRESRRGGGDRPVRRGHRPGDLRLRHPQRRHRAQRRAGRGGARDASPSGSANSPARSGSSGPTTCPRPAPARSCGGCCATSPKAGRWAT